MDGDGDEMSWGRMGWGQIIIIGMVGDGFNVYGYGWGWGQLFVPAHLSKADAV